jgi:hypothetical protein
VISPADLISKPFSHKFCFVDPRWMFQDLSMWNQSVKNQNNDIRKRFVEDEQCGISIWLNVGLTLGADGALYHPMTPVAVKYIAPTKTVNRRSVAQRQSSSSPLQT